MTTDEHARVSATDGWRALRDGSWESARDAFERALTAEATPESHEGLSWSAWWLDDAETVFAARTAAYRGYRERGDTASAARMATWLAVDELDFRGAVSVAGGWLERARRLLEPLEPGPDHGWLAFHEGYLAHAAGDSARAEERARAAADHGRRFGVPDLEMLGLALEGATLVARARVDEGMRCLDEATAVALEGEAAVPISSAWTFCFLVGACAAVQDYERAFEWCGRIAEFAERWGSRYMLAFCRAEYGSVHLARGRWEDAETVLSASVDDFAASRPAWVHGPLVELAELRRRQGRAADAADLLEEARASLAARLVRARLALDAGDARRAADLVERLLRQLPPDRVLDRIPALELLVHARAAAGRLDDASRALDALREADALVGTEALRGRVDFAHGMLAAATGDHEGARTFLEDAVDRLERAVTPFEEARARTQLATTLLALGRRDEAEAEASRALDRFGELGAAGEAEQARAIVAACAGGPKSLTTVTPREREVLALLAGGLTNREIAERLVLSEHTVHRHVTNILRKLDLPSRTAAAAHAIRTGLLDEPPS